MPVGHHRDRRPPGRSGDRRAARSSSCRGPIFCNMLLADEINRTPAQDRRRRSWRRCRSGTSPVGANTLPAAEPPFFVLATQNPIEQEGTYPLPEARSTGSCSTSWSSTRAAEELRILKQTTSGDEPQLKHALTGEQILARRKSSARCRSPSTSSSMPATWSGSDAAERRRRDELREASPSPGGRARGPGSISSSGAKARAILEGRFHVSTDDVKAVAAPVLRHRIVTTFQASSEGVSPDNVVEQLISAIPVDLHERGKKLTRVWGSLQSSVVSFLSSKIWNASARGTSISSRAFVEHANAKLLAGVVEEEPHDQYRPGSPSQRAPSGVNIRSGDLQQQRMVSPARRSLRSRR